MSEYGQGAIDLLEILGIDADAAVGDLMTKLKSSNDQANSRIRDLQERVGQLVATHILEKTTITDAWAEDIRTQQLKHAAHLEDIDSVAAEAHIEVLCRSCEEYYTLDYEISQFRVDTSYCGRSESCCP